jgi:hypothetical protein
MSAYPTPRYRQDEPARKLASNIPTTTARPLYTVPSGKRCTITLLNMTNIHSSSTTINIYHTRAGELPANINAIYYEVTIAKNIVSQDVGPFYMGAGESLWALCSTGNHAAITVYGIEE